jgi:hypothetical protein
MPTTNAWNSNVPVEVTKGGTNAVAMSTSSGILKYDATSLVTSTTATIDANNLYTNTSQPAFCYVISAVVADVTGKDALYTIIFDEKIFENGANFNTGTGTFTAPKTGLYLFIVGVYMTNISTVMNEMYLRIVTTAATYETYLGPRATGTTKDLIKEHSCIAAMTAGDTAYCTVIVTGGAANTADITNTGDSTNFSGVLLT